MPRAVAMPPRVVHVGGQRIRVVRVAGLRDAAGAALDGVYIHEDSTIKLDRALAPERAWAVFFHELAHAAFHVSGAVVKLESAAPSQASELEEDLAWSVATHLVGALRHARLLRIPQRRTA